MDPNETRTSEEIDRATRLAQQRGSWRRRALVTSVAVVLVIAGGVGAYVVVVNSQDASGTAAASPTSTTDAPSTTRATTTTTVPRTTTTTIPPVKQPKDQVLPDPGNGIRQGSRGPAVFIYEARMKELHFDPGHVDDVFDQDTWYAVSTVQKYFGLPRTGVIDQGVDFALTHFTYKPQEPKSEADRVEIDLDKQVLTLYKNWQPQLLTTTSTGSGAHFCGGVDGCQYAITPTGHFKFYELIHGWQKGKLGQMWNPYYFNGSIAVHGLASVPNSPASHGCARIPMHVADYFYTLVHDGLSVFVFGTPKQTGNGYIGPAPKAPAPPPTTVAPTTAAPVTAAPVTTPTTKKPTPTTVKSTGTTKPRTTTTPSTPAP